MGNLFNAAEVVDMGIEKEKKRRDFYALVAERFTEKEMKELFTKLRDWEETHIRKFTEIRKSLKEVEATDSYPGELKDYINALVDTQLYSEVTPENFSRNIKTQVDAIQRGIGFEKDAILFFRELLPYAGTANRESIDKLIDEEKQHLIYLTELKRKFQK